MTAVAQSHANIVIVIIASRRHRCTSFSALPDRATAHTGEWMSWQHPSPDAECNDDRPPDRHCHSPSDHHSTRRWCHCCARRCCRSSSSSSSSTPPSRRHQRPSSSSSSSPFDPSSLSSPSLDSVHITNLTCGLLIDPYHYHSFDVVSRNHAGWNTPISLYVGAFRYCAFCSVRLGFAGGIGIGGDDDDENEE